MHFAREPIFHFIDFWRKNLLQLRMDWDWNELSTLKAWILIKAIVSSRKMEKKVWISGFIHHLFKWVRDLKKVEVKLRWINRPNYRLRDTKSNSKAVKSKSFYGPVFYLPTFVIVTVTTILTCMKIANFSFFVLLYTRIHSHEWKIVFFDSLLSSLCIHSSESLSPFQRQRCFVHHAFRSTEMIWYCSNWKLEKSKVSYLVVVFQKV